MNSAARSTLALSVIAVSIAASTSSALESNPAEFPYHADSAAVVAAVDSFHAALESGDSAAVLSLLAPDAVILESGGVETRAEYRSHHLAGDIAFARAVKTVRAPLKVFISGTAAWTLGTSSAQGEFNGRQINSTGAETMILTKSGATWKIRSIHWSSRTRRPAAQ